MARIIGRILIRVWIINSPVFLCSTPQSVTSLSLLSFCGLKFMTSPVVDSEVKRPWKNVRLSEIWSVVSVSQSVSFIRCPSKNGRMGYIYSGGDYRWPNTDSGRLLDMLQSQSQSVNNWWWRRSRNEHFGGHLIVIITQEEISSQSPPSTGAKSGNVEQISRCGV